MKVTKWSIMIIINVLIGVNSIDNLYAKQSIFDKIRLGTYNRTHQTITRNNDSVNSNVDNDDSIGKKYDNKVDQSSLSVSEMEQIAFDLINKYRISQKRKPLKYTTNGRDAARKNNIIQSKRGCGHYVGGHMGECAAGNYSPEGVVRAWINSPGHRSILLKNNTVNATIVRSNGYWTFRYVK